MKIKLLLASLVALSAYANAASDNTVQFQGMVSTQTCNVNINGNAETPIVLLPTVAATELAKAKDTAGATKFTVNVTDCQSAAANISVVFAGNNVTTNGNLGNTTDGDASNVSIQLLNVDGTTPLTFTNGSTVSTTAFTKAADSTSASQDLIARYYAEAADVGAGAVTASAQYSISYN